MTNLPTRLLWGEDAIEEELGGLRFRVSANAFLQTNTEMAEVLYGLAREYAGLSGSETVWDLYCGIGTIGLSLAADALTVWGVEVSEEAVARAIENAELNGITNAAFAGNVGQAVDELRERTGDPDVVVVDPPRAGLAGKALRRLGRIGAPRIVYVSCNPTTLASDVKTLRTEFGYELRRARPVDMFPHAARRDGGRTRSRRLDAVANEGDRLQPVPDLDARGTRATAGRRSRPGTRSRAAAARETPEVQEVRQREREPERRCHQ